MLGALALQVARVRVLQGILHRCAGIGPAGDLVVGCPATKELRALDEPSARAPPISDQHALESVIDLNRNH